DIRKFGDLRRKLTWRLAYRKYCTPRLSDSDRDLLFGEVEFKSDPSGQLLLEYDDYCEGPDPDDFSNLDDFYCEFRRWEQDFPDYAKALRRWAKLQVAAYDLSLNIYYQRFARWEKDFPDYMRHLKRFVLSGIDSRKNGCYHEFQLWEQDSPDYAEALKRWFGLETAYDRSVENRTPSITAYDRSVENRTPSITTDSRYEQLPLFEYDNYFEPPDPDDFPTTISVLKRAVYRAGLGEDDVKKFGDLRYKRTWRLAHREYCTPKLITADSHSPPMRRVG
ncbi:MAG: hypothetical protein F6K40_32365, partial [Okeania sp. SIO3I5]|uniref:hypothetical protein n=1 Tax=Okeania sp. SIO3I5 TaxID=2607805 RepID=UPI0013BC4555